MGFADWAWLINSEIARNKWPIWNPNYGTDAQHHVKVRGYFTFLFATQMPDMRITSEMSDEQKSHYPQKFNIPEEGEIIEDFHPQSKNINKWVGQIQQHTFHFKVVDNDKGINGFMPYKTLSATKAKQLGEAAIKCIGNKIKNEEDHYKSAMKPEAAAGWLGAMTHYIADMAAPAHLLEHKSYKEVYTKQYHNWFEDQLASVTKWNKALGAHGGPETIYFSWDISKIGRSGAIIPLSPEIAVTFMAVLAINIVYRTDGNHQHIEFNGHNEEEALNSGLYLNSTDYHWDWKKDLEINGRNGGSHKYFYDKVERLLCWAVYYTACAMQYCLNEGEKKTEGQPLNPDYWVTRDLDNIPREIPSEIPARNFEDSSNSKGSTDRISRIFRNIGPSVGAILIGIAQMLQKTFYLTGR